MDNRLWFRWLSQGAFILAFVYLIVLTAPGECATSRTSKACRNETTKVKVNVTEEVLCARLSLTYCWVVGSCYCNETNEVEKTHVTYVCEELTVVDGEGSGENKSAEERRLKDPEVAAIAVISSLVFSILLSLTVFCVQRRCRVCTRRKNDTHTQVVQVERGGGDAGALGGEDEKFLSQGDEKRYIRVEAANTEQNVYEDVQGRHGGLELPMKGLKESGKLSANPGQSYPTPHRISTSPSGVIVADRTIPSNRHSTASSTQIETPLISHSTTSPPSGRRKTSTPSPVPSAAHSDGGGKADSTTHSDAEKADSTSSQRLSGSEDHYENIRTSVL